MVKATRSHHRVACHRLLSTTHDQPIDQPTDPDREATTARRVDRTTGGNPGNDPQGGTPLWPPLRSLEVLQRRLATGLGVSARARG